MKYKNYKLLVILFLQNLNTIKRTKKMKKIIISVFVLGLLIHTGCKENKQSVTPEMAQTIAKEAFIYVYPMLYNYRTMLEIVENKDADSYIGKFNAWKHYTRLMTPKDELWVTPNNDTPYSVAFLDLRTEPIVLSHADIPDNRYFTFQLVDVYTYNFAYIGSRTTGNDAGNFLIAGPNWEGEKPEGITKVLKTEGYLVYINGRTGVSGVDDLVNVVDIQNTYKLTPLSEFMNEEAPEKVSDIDFIEWEESKALSGNFIEYFNFLLQFSEIHPSEIELFKKFKKIGIEKGINVADIKNDTAIVSSIQQGVKDAIQMLSDSSKTIPNGDNYFGTRDFLENNYFTRAVAAYVGIYGNSKEESMYGQYIKGSDGEAPDGSKKYTIYFSKENMPPVNFFWSITIYNLPQRLLIENPINRYSTGTITPGLKYSDDGSLTIYIQKESPGGDKELNWLPAPDGTFFLVSRYYGPQERLLNRTWIEPELQVVK